MYTECTECRQQQAITIKELRHSQAIVRCSSCSSLFNALDHLTEKPITNSAHNNQPLPTEISFKKPFNWHLGVTFCFILFILQIYYFEGYTLSQNNTLRPWLNKLCHQFECKLPVYKNLNEFTILHGSFQAVTEHHAIFRTTFTNQADFSQKPPSIKLTLQNFTGDDFAQRIFHPHDYLNHNSQMIKSEISTEIALDIATPSNKIGGYRFELI